ncbi:hypothetical protein ACFYO7_29360 [Nocardia salmonicida]
MDQVVGESSAVADERDRLACRTLETSQHLLLIVEVLLAQLAQSDVR